MPWFSAFHTWEECSLEGMSISSTYLQNVSTKLKILDALSEHVHNVDIFLAELFEDLVGTTFKCQLFFKS